MARTEAFCEGEEFYCYSLGQAKPDEKVIDAYRRYGFARHSSESEALVRSRLKPRYDRQCVFMYSIL